jgi:hypothetical protein
MATVSESLTLPSLLLQSGRVNIRRTVYTGATAFVSETRINFHYMTSVSKGESIVNS